MNLAKAIYFATIHPEFIRSYLKFGIFKSAIDKGIIDIHVIDLRDFAVDKHGSVDAYPYGGGDSMVMRPEPIKSAIDYVCSESGVSPLVIYTSPKGVQWNQEQAMELSVYLKQEASTADKEVDTFRVGDDASQPLLFICGRFAGVDQRIIDHYVHRQYSLGDFVISGGELACLIIADSITRLVPGVVGNHESVEVDSFSQALDGCLEYPLYTRPVSFEGHTVPEVLLSGDHAKIKRWRQEMSKMLTARTRPDLLR
ncbi:MAG: tRNA (guanine(37)-N(1))-methyltransferase [Bdellovibrionota bacterium]